MSKYMKVRNDFVTTVKNDDGGGPVPVPLPVVANSNETQKIVGPPIPPLIMLAEVEKGKKATEIDDPGGVPIPPRILS